MNVPKNWVSHPHEWQPFFTQWAADNPDGTTSHSWAQYGMEKVIGLTCGNPEAAKRLLVTVPHAHEPAGTGAAVNVAAQLVTGWQLDGSLTALPVAEVLRHCLITFLPDTNPQGRAKSPERFWDGSRDNDTFLKIAFGIAAGGERFGRYVAWSLSEHRPRQIGIEYEQVTDDLFVEPNTSRRSTHFRAVTELHACYHYTHHLDMHQHEYPPAALLPADFEELPQQNQDEIATWARRIISGWAALGGQPRLKPSIPYKGQERQRAFKAFWQDACPGMLRLTTEVRNNRDHKTGTPAALEQQLALATAALVQTLTHLIA